MSSYKELTLLARELKREYISVLDEIKKLEEPVSNFNGDVGSYLSRLENDAELSINLRMKSIMENCLSELKEQMKNIEGK